MKFTQSCEDKLHIRDGNGQCLTCEYLRDLSVWESGPDFIEGEIR